MLAIPIEIVSLGSHFPDRLKRQAMAKPTPKPDRDGGKNRKGRIMKNPRFKEPRQLGTIKRKEARAAENVELVKAGLRVWKVFTVRGQE